MTDEQTTERRERVARALREAMFGGIEEPIEAGWLRLADAAIAAYESLEPRYEQVGWWNERRGCHDIAYTPSRHHDYECFVTDEPVYRRVVPPQEGRNGSVEAAESVAQEAEGRRQITWAEAWAELGALDMDVDSHIPDHPQEAEGTCPTCGGRGVIPFESDDPEAPEFEPCPDPFHSVSPNPEGTNDGE